MTGRGSTWDVVGNVALAALGAVSLYIAAEATAEIILDSREIADREAKQRRLAAEEEARLAPERAKIRARLSRYLDPEPPGIYPTLTVPETGFQSYPHAAVKSRWRKLMDAALAKLGL